MGKQEQNQWRALTEGKTIGKRSVAMFTTPTFNLKSVPGVIDMFTIQGDDQNALQLSVSVSPPRILSRNNAASVNLQALQNLTNTQDNVQLWKPAILGAQDPSAWANPIAILEWGIGGVQNQQIEVDVMNGTVVNICASYVRLKCGFAVDSQPGFFGDPNFLVPYEFAAFIGPGRPKDLGAQRTVLVGGVDDGVETSIVPVPRFAKKITPSGIFGVAGHVFVGEIRFYRDILGVNDNGSFTFSDNVPGPFAIPNGAQYFSVVNGSGAQVSIQAIFDLAI